VKSRRQAIDSLNKGEQTTVSSSALWGNRGLSPMLFT